MTQDLEKWTNQARFIQMIIEGKLIVSKKKKNVLVQELREKSFKPISKSNDAMKDKNLDPLADEDEEMEHEEDAELGAADFDYLLGMPIWSLTKERIERLQKQIGEREVEVDTLSKLTPQDIWKKDLDDFIHEWQFQLQDEADRQKKAAKMGRRASRKVNIGVGSRNRKANNLDDSDFDVAPKAKKATAPKPLPGGMLNYLVENDKPKKTSKPKAPTATEKFAQKAISEDWFGTSTKRGEEKKAQDNDDDIWMSLDGATEANKPKAPMALKKPITQRKDVVPSDSDVEEEVARPAAGHKPRRAAARKPAKYTLSDSDDSDGDFDVGAMVKGIDNGSATADNSRPLFSASMSRPGSSAGLPRKSTTTKDAFDVDADDTDYTKLAPPTTSKGPAVTARKTILSDDGDDSLLASSPPAKAAKPATYSKPVITKSSKTAPKPQKGINKRDPTPQPAPKPTTLSPAAKAYAAKKAKSAAQADKMSQLSEDEVDKVANEIMDDDDDQDVLVAQPRAASARPGRAAAAKAASKSKKYAFSDDEEDEDEDEEEESEEEFEEDESFE